MKNTIIIPLLKTLASSLFVVFVAYWVCEYIDEPLLSILESGSFLSKIGLLLLSLGGMLLMFDTYISTELSIKYDWISRLSYKLCIIGLAIGFFDMLILAKGFGALIE